MKAAGPPSRPGRKRTWLLAALLLALAGVGGAYWLLLPAPPAPPDIDLSGVDPDVRAAVETARAEVQRRPRSGKVWGQLGMVLRAHDFGPESSVCFLEA